MYIIWNANRNVSIIQNSMLILHGDAITYCKFPSVYMHFLELLKRGLHTEVRIMTGIYTVMIGISLKSYGACFNVRVLLDNTELTLHQSIFSGIFEGLSFS